MKYIEQIRLDNQKRYKAFGHKLKLVRNKQGLTHKDLGNLIGKCSAMISQYENGKTFPNAKTLNKIAEVFNMTKDELLYEDIICPYCGKRME